MIRGKMHSYMTAVAIAMLLPFGLAWAHHSTAMFDFDNPMELRGVVVEWQFTNPHTFIILEVPSEQGEPVLWELEGGNVRGAIARGWNAQTLKPGDEIVVTIRPLRSGAPGGNYSTVLWPDGRPVGPDR